MADPDYFTLAEFRLLPEMSDATTYTEAKVLASAAYFTAAVDREVFGETGEGFIPRTIVQTLDGDGCASLVLASVNVRSLTSVTVGGSTVATNLLSGTDGILRYLGGSRWPRGVSNVVVTYSAGKYAACPEDIKDPLMWATRDRLIAQSVNSGSWDRKSSEISDYGTVNYVLAGEKRPTGYPDLDAAIAGRCRATAPLGFA